MVSASSGLICVGGQIIAHRENLIPIEVVRAEKLIAE